MPDRRRPLTESELERLGRALDPSARIVHSEPLLGGLDWGTYAIEMDGPAGPRSLVLRRFDGGPRPLDAAGRLWTALTAVRTTALPVPHPVLRDAGPLLGAPAIVMTRCEGAIRPPPADASPWVEEYASLAFRIHATDLGTLGGPLPTCTDRRAILGRFLERPAGPDARAAWDRLAAILQERVDAVGDVPRRLRHRDLWFGNTLWVGDRITGIVDWSGACVGDPRGDVAYARLDVQLVLGAEPAREFQLAYERRSGPLELAWWELVAAIDGLAWLAEWVDGYREVGLTDLTVPIARARLDGFIADATRRLGADRR